MLTHTQLINKIVEFKHYPTDEKGMCHGIALMGTQAVLADDIPSLHRRLSLLTKTPDNKLQDTIKNVRSKQVELHNRAREALQSAWVDKVKKINRAGSFEKQLTTEESRQYYHELSKALLNADLQLSEEDRDLLSIEAFFQGITIHCSPDEFTELFENSQTNLNQNPEVTFPKVLPKKLTNESDKFEQSGVSLIVQWSGVYTKNNLVKYLLLLKKYLNNKHCKDTTVFFLSSGNHAITLSYEPKIHSWRIIDANQLSLLDKTTKSTRQITNYVFQAFKNKGAVAFSTLVFAKTTHKNQVAKSLHLCQKRKTWNQLHKVSKFKAQLADAFDTNWLFIAARAGDANTVKQLIAVDHTLCDKQSCGKTPLFIAVQYGHTQVIQELLLNRADVNKSTDKNVTPLFMAASRGDIDTVKLFLKANANTDIAKHDDNATAIAIAIQNNHTDIVDLLIKAGADINKSLTSGVTPLYMSCLHGHHDQIELLLNANANPDLVNKNQNLTPLMLAADSGDSKMTALLIDHKATLNLRGDQGQTALVLAAQNGHAQVVDLLLDGHGKDAVDIPLNVGATPLLLAAQNGRADIVNALIAAKASIDNAINDGSTPLIVAIRKGHTAIVKALLEAKANTELSQLNGNSPLLAAITYNHIGIAKLLLEAGANVDREYNIDKLPWLHTLFDAVAILDNPGMRELFKSYEMYSKIKQDEFNEAALVKLKKLRCDSEVFDNSYHNYQTLCEHTEDLKNYIHQSQDTVSETQHKLVDDLKHVIQTSYQTFALAENKKIEQEVIEKLIQTVKNLLSTIKQGSIAPPSSALFSQSPLQSLTKWLEQHAVVIEPSFLHHKSG